MAIQLEQIEVLKLELDALRPLNNDAEPILWDKFRLEWNYNSNHIEGNTLSYGDTKLLLRLGDEFRAGDNPLKDVQEMKAHDVAIHLIRDWASDPEKVLTEKDIRELNEIILVKPFWSDAQTADGLQTRREIIPGKYKEHPNHVQLKSGEIFRYAEPHEVAAEMQELIDWYRSDDHEHPIITAAYLHYKFVLIHPFDDGNGRVSRLLMNYHLMRNGYPPLIIKSDDKDNYLYALRQADAGDIKAFVSYLAEQLKWSMHLEIKAANGGNIEESEDIYKEIELWKREVIANNKPIKNKDGVRDLWLYSIKPLFEKLTNKLAVFNELFRENKTEFTNGSMHYDNISELAANINYRDCSFLSMVTYFGGFTNNSDHSLLDTITAVLEIKITKKEYIINYNFKAEKKKLTTKLDEDSQNEIVKTITKKVFNEIKDLEVNSDF